MDNLHFLLLGEGPLKKHAVNFLRDNNLSSYVCLAGRVGHREVPQYLAAMDILLSPHNPLQEDKNKFHGSPLKLFEYMAMAKPIIASKVGQIGELLQDGNNAILINPGNDEELFNAILLLSKDEDLRVKLGERAREIILSRYTWDNNASKVIDIVRMLHMKHL